MRNDLLHILQHSLGLDQYGQGNQYRNHFVAGGKDVGLCRELVGLGYMVERTASSMTGGDPWFSVTPAGVDAVAFESPRPPKVSKSKQRYRRWLEYGDSFDSFIDFCRWDADPEREWNGRRATV
jgi:hypothetical protein